MDRGGAALNRVLLRGPALLWAGPLAFLALFYAYPLAGIVATSFAREADGLLRALASPATGRVVLFTLGQAAASTALTLLVGLPGAYLVARYRFAGKTLFRALTAIPFVLPTLVVAAAFDALLGSRGWVNAALEAAGLPPLRFTRTLGAILIAHVFYNTTIVLRLVGDYWSRIDRRLWDAARTLGAGAAQRWLRVSLPLLAAPVAAAAVLVFIFCFTSFGVILILGGPRFATIEVEIYYQTISLFDLPVAASLALVQVAITLVLGIAYTRLMRRVSRPLPLRAPRTNERSLTGRRARALAAAVLLGIAIFQLAPMAALAARSVSGAEGPTLAFYRALSTESRQGAFHGSALSAVRNSLGFAAAATVIALAVGTPAAWALGRHGASRSSRLFDPLLMLPLGTSAVTLGLGFIVTLNRPPVDLRASPLLIPIAHALVALPFVVRSLAPALATVEPRLIQAARVLGAGRAAVARRVELPIVARAMGVAAAFAFSISLGEFGATAIVARGDLPTIPLAIFRLLGRPGALNLGQGLALATILMLVTAVVVTAIERLRVARVSSF